LAHRQHAARADAGVFQQVERDETIIGACLWVFENVGKLLEVFGAQQVGDVTHCMFGQGCNCT
jgi:hypothetical protein